MKPLPGFLVSFALLFVCCTAAFGQAVISPTPDDNSLGPSKIAGSSHLKMDRAPIGVVLSDPVRGSSNAVLSVAVGGQGSVVRGRLAAFIAANEAKNRATRPNAFPVPQQAPNPPSKIGCGIWCGLAMADYAASVTVDIESQLHCQKFGCIEKGIAKNSKGQLSVPKAIGFDVGLAALPVVMRLGFTRGKVDARIYEAMLHGLAGAHWYATVHNFHLATDLKNGH